MKPFKIIVSCLLYWVIQFGYINYSFADVKEVRIGVLAFRPIEISKQQWQPTADYLNAKLPEYHFTITPLNYPDLDLAVNRRQFDFVITNPEHYITIREDHGINAIATLMPSIGGHPYANFGGVIFTRSDRADINVLDDIKNKVVASPTKQSVGGYSMQIWTLLKNGFQKDQIKQFRFTGMPHDNVVLEVIAGKADVGFVRTGVLEAMARSGKIRLDQVKVLNRQPPEKFPLLLSTDLYPEWPLAAELDVPQSLIKTVELALLNIDPNDRAAQAGQYYGFASTGDYSSIESLMKRISENPERAHEFDLRDIARKYSIQIQVAGLIVILAILATAIYLFRVNKTVIRISKNREQLTRKLEEVNADLQTANADLLTEKAHQEELIRKLAEAHNQLLQSEKMASIGQLAAGVAHEINNPIGFVNSNLGTLKHYIMDLLRALSVYEANEGELTAETRNVLVELKRQIDIVYLREDVDNLLTESMEGMQRVKRIVQDLKDFSHVDESEMQLANLEQGLDSTLNVVWNELKYKADVVKEYGGIPKILCMPAQLNQVFMNLLTNAAQAIETHGSITIRTGQEGNNVWAEVEDTGKGIKPEHLKRIFDPFFTTKPVGSGTGLGLSLSYGIVQQHGGRIEVKSEVGKGSVFRVVLPLNCSPATSIDKQNLNAD